MIDVLPEYIEIIEGEPPEGLHHQPIYLSEDGQSALRQNVMDFVEQLKRTYRRNVGWEAAKNYGYAGEVFWEHQIDWLQDIDRRLIADSFASRETGRIELLHYHIGKGINSHKDSGTHNCLAVLSLGETCVLEMQREGTRDQIKLLVEPGSLYVLKGEALNKWGHGIQDGTTCNFQGREIQLTKRRLAVCLRSYV